MDRKAQGINEARQNIIKYLRNELLGPRDGEKEELTDPPFIRYSLGTIFPQQSDSDTLNPNEEKDAVGVSGATGDNPLSQREDQSDDPVGLANQYLPSSMGISFFLTHNPTIEIDVSAGRYEETHVDRLSTVRASAKGYYFKRIPLSIHQVINPDVKMKYQEDIFDGRAQIYAIWRPNKNGWLVTITLINLRQSFTSSPEEESCLHQVKIICRSQGDGEIRVYPQANIRTDDTEEGVYNLLYRKKYVFGIGHGCSVDWKPSDTEETSEIWSEFIPAYDVPPTVYSLPKNYEKYENCLGLYHLACGEEYRGLLIRELEDFVQGYKNWITEEPSRNGDISLELDVEKAWLLDKLNLASERMATGVRLLKQDSTIFNAFCLANHVMLQQYIHSTQPQYAGKQHEPGKHNYNPPDLTRFQDRKWRPFQLAFLLLTIPSVAFLEDPDRDVVDLIWFPTGGGKTEAYLAISAFQIFYRRMMYGDKGYGTTILMRYTLRLLTTQQFQRASTLFCACELVRRNNPEKFGHEPVSIGLWLGSEATPNTYEEAFRQYNDYKDGTRSRNPFQIEICPWCGTIIIPPIKKVKEWEYGVQISPEHFSLNCLEPTCPFHDSLPVGVVDQQLYDNPPTLLLATVDKFARMTWEERVGRFFGDHYRRPPELIIQDELHLISGPLGTIVGIYETAIDGLASWHGTIPKIIASTATIRRADDQCNGLYSRRVEMFPPAGLDASNSYFTRYDEDQPGRLYIGIMGQGHTASTTMIRTSAALLQAPLELGLSGDQEDAFWTLVAYHNSLREVGKSLTFASDDIPARITVIAKDSFSTRKLNADNYDQLTSSTKDLNGMLERLKRKAGEDQSISLLICTNMLSVGVDVQRLGLMLVNGQPKSTSEYIQATSRVGRGFPGLVVTMLSATKPRDRSHYERFIAYHSALYRYVEPTSVTPFSPPSRGRALHAVLVSMVRHALGLNNNLDAQRFAISLQDLDRVKQFILDRVKSVDPQELEGVTQQLNLLIGEWEKRTDQSANLHYESKQKQIPALLKQAGSTSKQKGWDTLNSMRNVDRSCVLKVHQG